MTNEELDAARAKEGVRLWQLCRDVNGPAHAVITARLAREGWTPPCPDLLAYQEWWRSEDGCDNVGQAYLAGARMAREQEQERANPVVAFAVRVMAGVFNDSDHTKREARKAIDEYEGEV